MPADRGALALRRPMRASRPPSSRHTDSSRTQAHRLRRRRHRRMSRRRPRPQLQRPPAATTHRDRSDRSSVHCCTSCQLERNGKAEASPAIHRGARDPRTASAWDLLVRGHTALTFVIASAAKTIQIFPGGSLDCFAALAMTMVWHERSAPRRLKSPDICAADPARPSVRPTCRSTPSCRAR